MGFESGSVGFRLFYLQQSFTREIVARFAAMAAPPVETLGREPIHGWVTGRHLLDRQIREETCVLGGYLHVSLMRAERKLPEALLRAYCRLEEEVELKARDAALLPRQVRAEIKSRIIEQLLPTMPPTLSGIPAVLDFRNELLLAGAMSDKQLDIFSAYFRETTGSLPIVLTPSTAALHRKQVNARDLSPTSFSPDPDVAPADETDLGMEFLTWLWHHLESGGGNVTLTDGASYGLLLEGPATFFCEGEGAHEAVLRKGTPLVSREAGTALVCGKQLRRARLTVAKGDLLWGAQIDSELSIRGLKLPKGEQMDPVGRFQERMLFIEEYWSLLLALYDSFLDVRSDAKAWPETVTAIREWAAQRAQG